MKSDKSIQRRMAKYMDVHKNNPPYAFQKLPFWGTYEFLYQESRVFTLMFCSRDLAERIASLLNAAYLEGWLDAQNEFEN